MFDRLPDLALTLRAAVGPTLKVATGASDAERLAGAQAAVGSALCEYLQRRNVWATVGTSYPVGKRESKLDYSSSSETKFGIAVSLNAEETSWVSSGTKTLEDSWGQGFVYSSKPRSYRVKVKYQYVRCRNRDGIIISRNWKPIEQPGYTKEYELSSRPDWKQFCGPVARGDWWRGRMRGNDYSHNAGVKFKSVLGINLRTSRAYSTESKLWYGSPVKHALCGNNADIAEASKIRERFKVPN